MVLQLLPPSTTFPDRLALGQLHQCGAEVQSRACQEVKVPLRIPSHRKLDPVPRVNSCPRGFYCCVKLDSSYQVSTIAEIFLVNQHGKLEKQLDPGR